MTNRAAESDGHWWSKAIYIGAVIGVVLLPLGALGARFGLWPFGIGFLFLAAGTLLATIGLVGGLIGYVIARRRGYAADRGPLAIGMVLSALVVALMGLQFYRASSVPQIHNITTDTADPPQFDKVIGLRSADSNPLDYDAATLAPQQQAAYPFLKSLTLAAPVDAVVERVSEVLESMGLDVVNTFVSGGEGLVEAVDTTFWFGFKDDVAVRVRPTAEVGPALTCAASAGLARATWG